MKDNHDSKRVYERTDYEDCLPMPMYATVYIKFQKLNTLYHPIEGLKRGTIFPELYSPY